MIFKGIRCFLGDTKTVSEVALMPAPALRLSDRQLKAVKAKDKDYVLSDGDGLQLRVRSNGSMLWNFNYREPVTKNRINMGLGTYPELSLANARKKVVEARPSPSTKPRPRGFVLSGPSVSGRCAIEV